MCMVKAANEYDENHLFHPGFVIYFIFYPPNKWLLLVKQFCPNHINNLRYWLHNFCISFFLSYFLNFFLSEFLSFFFLSFFLNFFLFEFLSFFLFSFFFPLFLFLIFTVKISWVWRDLKSFFLAKLLIQYIGDVL